jgi:hypothetical protein
MTLPNFLVIGAHKAGTTSLYHYLKQHPEIYMSPLKEPRFFSFEGEEPDFRGPLPEVPGRPLVVTDLEAYRALFAGVSSEKAIGEVSPGYLYREKAPGRIRHYIPEAKLIAILRNPVERAYSHFLMVRKNDREPLTDFARALEAEEERIKDNWWIGHYKSMGFYHEQLTRYYELFDREQIRVYLYEDFDKDPVAVTQSIFRFLEVNDSFVPDTSRRFNVSGVPKSRAVHTLIKKPNPLKSALKPFLPRGLRWRISAKLHESNLRGAPPLPEEIRKELTEAYREDILKLEGLIGRDLSGWLGEGAS